MSEPTHNPHGYAIAHGRARTFLEATIAWRMAECDIEEAIDGHLGGADFTFHADPYDGSIEVYVADLADPEPLGSFLLGLGFARCWVHMHDQRPDESVRSGHGCRFVDNACDRQRYFTRDQPRKDA